MNKNFDLAIISWSLGEAKKQCQRWEIGIYPRPYRHDGINALLVKDAYQLNFDLDVPVVIIRMPDGSYPTSFDGWYAALQVMHMGSNYFLFDGEVSMSLEDILKKRIKVIGIDGKRHWVLEEQVDG